MEEFNFRKPESGGGNRVKGTKKDQAQLCQSMG